MSEIVIHYFDIYGNVEVLKWYCEHAGVSYRFEPVTAEYWYEHKFGGEYTEFGRTPMIDVDGHRLSQKVPILRYLGKKHGYYPTGDDYKEWLIDAILDLHLDICQWIFSYGYHQPDQEQLTAKLNEDIPLILNALLKRRQKEGFKWLTGDQVTVADVAIFQSVYDFFLNAQFRAERESLLVEKVPGMKELCEEFIASSDRLTQYLANRPERPI